MNSHIYVFDYDDTLKAGDGPLPSTSKLKKLVNVARSQSGYPLIIFTAGLGRSNDDFIELNPDIMRPVDWTFNSGLSVSHNEFIQECEVCVFDREFNKHGKYRRRLVDHNGKKCLGTLSYHLRTVHKIAPDILFFDDLNFHCIDPANSKDHFDRNSISYFHVEPIGTTQKKTDTRMDRYIKLIESQQVDTRCKWIKNVTCRVGKTKNK